MVNNFFIGKSELALVLTPGPSIRNVIVQFMNRTVLLLLCAVLFAGGSKRPIGTKLTQRESVATDLTIHLVMCSSTNLNGYRSGEFDSQFSVRVFSKNEYFRIKKRDKKHNYFEVRRTIKLLNLLKLDRNCKLQSSSLR